MGLQMGYKYKDKMSESQSERNHWQAKLVRKPKIQALEILWSQQMSFNVRNSI